MYLRQTSSKDGYIWFCQSLWLFRRNPASILFLIFIYLLFVQLVVLIPVVGALAVLILTPMISIGFMRVCRSIALDELLSPLVFIDSYRHSEPTIKRRLLGLGAIYAVAIIVISLVIASVMPTEALVSAVIQQQPLKSEAMQQLYAVLIAWLVLYLPFAMLMWFAPMLVFWQQMSLIKALFLSFIACWQHRKAFALYLAIWAGVVIVIPLIFETLLIWLGLENWMGLIVTPYSVLVLAVLYCSFYITWTGCFDDNLATEEGRPLTLL